MKSFTAITIFIILSFGFQSQGQNTITGNFPALAGQQVRLVGFNGFGIYNIATTKVSDEGLFLVQYSEKDFGMGYLAADTIAAPHQQNNPEKDIALFSNDISSSYNTAFDVITIVEDQFNKGPVVNIWQLIMGKIPGLFVLQASGSPGSNVTVIGSNPLELSRSSYPQIIVDGLPVALPNSPDRDPLNWLNPSDVESVTYFRESATRAIFGANSDKGVLVIRTKRASKTQDTKVSYQTNLLYRTPGKMVDVLAADTYRALISSGEIAHQDLQHLLGTENTNWQGEIFKNTISHDHNISATGHLGFVPWRASANFTNQEGTLLTENLQRIGGSISLSPSFFDNNLNVSLSLNASRLNNRFAPHSAITNAVAFDPTKPVRDPGSPFEGYFVWQDENGPLPLATINPVAYLETTLDTNASTNLLMHGNICYRLYFLKDMKVNLMFSRQNNTSNRDRFMPGNAPWTRLYGEDLNENYSDTINRSYIEGWVDFKPSLGKNKFDFLIGYSHETQNASHWFFDNSFAPKSPNAKNSVVPYTRISYSVKHLSLFGRIGYSFDKRYFFDFSIRRDSNAWSFQKNSIFKSFAAAWSVHEESFWPSNPFLSKLKFRAGYGESDHRDNRIPYHITIPPNNDSKPYLSKTNSFGFDFSLFNNLVDGSFNVSNTKSYNVPFIVQHGLHNQLLFREGIVAHQSWDFSLMATPILNEKLSWSLSAHVTRQINKVERIGKLPGISFALLPDFNYNPFVGGGLPYHLPGEPSSSFYVLQNVYNSSGLPIEGLYVDQNGDGSIDLHDRISHKTTLPEFFMGISSSLTWKNWLFGFSGRACFGNYVYNRTSVLFSNYARILNASRYLQNITSESLDLNFFSSQGYSSHFVQEASFFRMDYISLGYKLGGVLKGLDLDVSATVQNAFVITNYKGVDPENALGIEFDGYALPKFFSIGIKVTF